MLTIAETEALKQAQRAKIKAKYEWDGMGLVQKQEKHCTTCRFSVFMGGGCILLDEDNECETWGFSKCMAYGFKKWALKEV